MWCNAQPLGFKFMLMHLIQGGHVMSRVSTPTAPATPSMKVPHEKIAMRAFDKWCKRGKPQGTDKQDWLEAEAELRTEMSRTGNSMPATQRR
jgi:hypothetical protein